MGWHGLNVTTFSGISTSVDCVDPLKIQNFPFQWKFHAREVVTLKLIFSIPFHSSGVAETYMNPSIPVEWMVQCRVEIPLGGKNFEFSQFRPSGLNVTVMFGNDQPLSTKSRRYRALIIESYRFLLKNK